MKTSGEQLLELAQRLGDDPSDEAIRKELQRLEREHQLAEPRQTQWKRWVTT